MRIQRVVISAMSRNKSINFDCLLSTPAASLPGMWDRNINGGQKRQLYILNALYMKQ